MSKLTRIPADTFKLSNGQQIDVYPVNALVCFLGNMDILATGTLIKEIGSEPFFLINTFTIDGVKPTIQQLMDLPVEDYLKILESIAAGDTNINDLFKK